MNKEELIFLVMGGAPERTRTSGPKIRNLVLYPPELRAPCHFYRGLSRVHQPLIFWRPFMVFVFPFSSFSSFFSFLGGSRERSFMAASLFSGFI